MLRTFTPFSFPDLFPNRAVVEVYNSFFGICTSFQSSIQNIMLNIPDSDQKIKWFAINVAKLEQDIRQQLQEDAKKSEDAQRRKAETDRLDGGAGVNGGVNSGGVGGKNSLSLDFGGRGAGGGGRGGFGGGGGGPSSPRMGGYDEDGKSSGADAFRLFEGSGSGVVAIPKLEAYSGYDKPRSVFLVLQDGEIKHTVVYPNPPKMMKILSAMCEGRVPDDADLAATELQSDQERIKEKVARRKEADEAKRKQREEAEAQRELDEPPRLILSLARDQSAVSRMCRSMAVVYARSGPETTNFDNYIGCTEASKVPPGTPWESVIELDPLVYNTAAPASAEEWRQQVQVRVLEVPDPLAQQQADHKAGAIPAAISHGPLAALLAGANALDEETLRSAALQDAVVGVVNVNLRQVLDISMAAAASSAAAGEGAEEDPNATTGGFACLSLISPSELAGPSASTSTSTSSSGSPGSLLVSVRPAEKRGRVSRIRMNLSCDNLPAIANAAAAAAAATTSPEAAAAAGSAASPSATTAPLDTIAVVYVRDANLTNFVFAGATEVRRDSVSPVYSLSVDVDVFSRLPRQVKVMIYYADQFDRTNTSVGLIAGTWFPLSALIAHNPNNTNANSDGAHGDGDAEKSNVAEVSLLDSTPGTYSVPHTVALHSPTPNAAFPDNVSLTVRALRLPARTPAVAGSAKARVVVHAKGITIPPNTLIAAFAAPASASSASASSSGPAGAPSGNVAAESEAANVLVALAPVSVHGIAEILVDEDQLPAIRALGLYEAAPHAASSSSSSSGADVLGPYLGASEIAAMPEATSPGLAPASVTVAFADAAGAVVAGASMQVQAMKLGAAQMVDCWVSAANLPIMDEGKCDPVVVVYRADAEGLVPLARTEVIGDNSNPVFHARLPIETYSQSPVRLVAHVFDLPSGSQEHDPITAGILIGQATIDVLGGAETVIRVPLERGGLVVQDAILSLTLVPAQPSVGTHANASATTSSSSSSSSGVGDSAAGHADKRKSMSSLAGAVTGANSASAEAALKEPQTLYMSLSARGLPRLAAKNAAAPDSMVALYRKNVETGQYNIVVQSSIVAGNENPDYPDLLEVQYDPHTANVYRFTFFDVASTSAMSRNESVGSIKLDLAHIVAFAANNNGGTAGRERAVVFRTPISTVSEGILPATSAASGPELLLSLYNAEEHRARTAAAAAAATNSSGDAASGAATVADDGATPGVQKQVAFIVRGRDLPAPASGAASLATVVALYRIVTGGSATLIGQSTPETSTDPMYPTSFVAELGNPSEEWYRLTVRDVAQPAEAEPLYYADVNLSELLQYYKKGETLPNVVELGIQLNDASGAPVNNGAGGSKPSTLLLTPVPIPAASTPTPTSTAEAASSAQTHEQETEAETKTENAAADVVAAVESTSTSTPSFAVGEAEASNADVAGVERGETNVQP